MKDRTLFDKTTQSLITRKLLLICVFGLMIFMSGCKKNIKLQKSALEYVGADYSVVCQELENMGFKNIDVKEFDDLTSQSVLKDSQVGRVKIDGVLNFSAKDKFPDDAEVIIEYHVIPKIKVPFSKEELNEYSFEELEKVFAEGKFINVSLSEEYDLDPDETMEDGVVTISINGSQNWSKDDMVPFDSSVIIIKHHQFEKYNAEIHIDFLGNLLLNKYDVDFYWGNEKVKTLSHGEDFDYKARCKAGEHTITFKNAGNDKVSGSISIDLNENKEASYQISCYEDKVSVKLLMLRAAAKDNETKVPKASRDYESKNYQEVQASLANAGFSNISTSAVYDIYFGITEVGSVASVSINGKTSFAQDDIFPKDALVIISYHMKEEDDPVKIAAKEEERKRQEEAARIEAERKAEEQRKAEEAAAKEAKYREELEKSIPLEMAKRAVIVAMTNGQATDVFKKDGNTYDEKKFHKYSDLGDFFLYVKKDGEWSAQSEYTWKVEGMVLAIYDATACIKVDCYIAKSDEAYKLMQVKKVMAAEEYLYSDDPSKINIETMDASKSDSHPYLIVPTKLVEADRDISKQNEIVTAREKHLEWIVGQFSMWDHSHTKSVELIKEQLYNPKSFKFIELGGYEIKNDDQLKTVNDLLKALGYSYKASKGDLLITTKYSAKNKDNERIEATAYTVSIEKEDVVVLLTLQ